MSRMMAIRRVELTHCHEEYDARRHHEDICLIKTTELIPFSHRIQPTNWPVATREQDEEEKSVNASGWGITLDDTE